MDAIVPRLREIFPDHATRVVKFLDMCVGNGYLVTRILHHFPHWIPVTNDINETDYTKAYHSSKEDFRDMNLRDLDYDILITATSFSLKREAITAAYLSGKYFAVMAPADLIRSQGMYGCFHHLGGEIIIMVPPPLLIYQADEMSIMDTQWYIGNITKRDPLEPVKVKLLQLGKFKAQPGKSFNTQLSQDYIMSLLNNDDAAGEKLADASASAIDGATSEAVDEDHLSVDCCDCCVKKVSDGLPGSCTLCDKKHICTACIKVQDETFVCLDCFNAAV